MTGDIPKATLEEAEVTFSHAGDNVYEFPTGKKMDVVEDNLLQELEEALANWF